MADPAGLRIISGGQTGVDQISLGCALAAGLPTGGTAPKYYNTETGGCPKLKLYGLKEHSSSKYPPRTEQNVRDSDATVIITANSSDSARSMAGRRSGGSALTYSYCIRHGKPCLVNPERELLIAFLSRPEYLTVNFAGTRGSDLYRDFTDELTATLRAVFSTARIRRFLKGHECRA